MKIKWLPLAAIAILALASAPSVHAAPAADVGGALGTTRATQDSVLSEIREAFLQLSEAESKGANVTLAAMDLNRALALAGSGDGSSLAEAAAIVDAVKSSIPSLAAEGEAARSWGTASIALTLVALGAAGALVYLYTPRLIWRIWVRAKKGWKVSAQ